jgi:hypothetical protein
VTEVVANDRCSWPQVHEELAPLDPLPQDPHPPEEVTSEVTSVEDVGDVLLHRVRGG